MNQFVGDLPRRDADETEADKALRHSSAKWPPIATLRGESPYRAQFKDGATIYPRRFFFVETEYAGRLGPNPAAPRLRGKTGPLDKKPWNGVEPPHGPVEIEFVRLVLLGESIAPFRVLAPASCVVPLSGRVLLNAETAAYQGFRHLAAWLRYCEAEWNARAARRIDGTSRMTLLQPLDHMRNLTSQFPIACLRVVYAKAGTLFAATRLEQTKVLVDHMAYWATARTLDEANYLCAILNSETARLRIAPMQPKGQGGARHFDNLIWELPIPDYERGIRLHRDLAAAGASAEQVAASVPLDPAAHFTRQRRAIRDALIADGIAARIDALVARLLDG